MENVGTLDEATEDDDKEFVESDVGASDVLDDAKLEFNNELVFEADWGAFDAGVVEFPPPPPPPHPDNINVVLSNSPEGNKYHLFIFLPLNEES